MKKITKDIRFVIAALVLVFVVLGWAAINAFAGGDVLGAGGSTSASEAEYTSTFYFKAAVLSLDTDSAPNTGFLVIANQEAVTGSHVDGTAVEVQRNPFAIKVLQAGTSKIFLSALMRSGEIKTISCTVIVQPKTVPLGGGGNEGSDGGKEEGDDGVHDGGLDESNSFQGNLLCKFDGKTVITFSLWIGETEVKEFWLSAKALEGDIKIIGIFGSDVEIKYLSENENFKIQVTATTEGGKIAATRTVENGLL